MPKKPVATQSASQVTQQALTQQAAATKATVQKLSTPEQPLAKAKPTVPALTHMQPESLNLALLKAQLELRANSQTTNQPQPGKSLLILVGGIELAGKGEAVMQLREWMDPRYLKVKASLSKPLASNQPFWQNDVDAIPACGQIAVLFGNWKSVV